MCRASGLLIIAVMQLQVYVGILVANCNNWSISQMVIKRFSFGVTGGVALIRFGV